MAPLFRQRDQHLCRPASGPHIWLLIFHKCFWSVYISIIVHYYNYNDYTGAYCYYYQKLVSDVIGEGISDSAFQEGASYARSLLTTYRAEERRKVHMHNSASSLVNFNKLYSKLAPGLTPYHKSSAPFTLYPGYGGGLANFRTRIRVVRS